MDLSASLESMTKPKTVLILPLLLIEAKKTVPAVQQFISCWEGFNKTYRGLRKTADQSAKIRKMFFFQSVTRARKKNSAYSLKCHWLKKSLFHLFTRLKIHHLIFIKVLRVPKINLIWSHSSSKQLGSLLTATQDTRTVRLFRSSSNDPN